MDTASESVSYEDDVFKLLVLCQKIKIGEPTYRELRTNNGEFMCECETFDVTTRGCSKNSVTAKQESARKMLDLFTNLNQLMKSKDIEKLYKSPLKDVPDNDTSTEEFGKPSGSNAPVDYMCKLNRTCLREKIELPIYKVLGKENNQVIVECQILDTITQGKSATKNIAKQFAAEAMLELLSKNNKFITKTVASKQQNKENDMAATTIKLPDTARLNKKPLQEISLVAVNNLSLHCSKRKFRAPEYYDCGVENDEFIIKCELFDQGCTFGISKNKEEAKQKAAVAMIKILVDDAKASCNSFAKSSKSHKLTDTVIESSNFIKKLKEFCVMGNLICPTYQEKGFQNGEFVIECNMFDLTFTEGRSKCKDEAKQKAAEAMLKFREQANKIRGFSLLSKRKL